MTAPASSARLAALADLHEKLGDPLSKETATALRALIAAREFVHAYTTALPTVGTSAARIAMQEIAEDLTAILGGSHGRS